MRPLTSLSLFPRLHPRAVATALAVSGSAFLGTACLAELGGETEPAPEPGVFAALASDPQAANTAPDAEPTALAEHDFSLAACGDGVHSSGELCFHAATMAGGISNYLDSIEAGLLNLGRNLDFVGSQAGSSDVIRVAIGNGAGSFSAAQTWSMGNGPNDVAYGDFNNDGHVDIIATNFDDDKARIRWGASSSPWATSHTYSVGNGPYRVRVADLDGDGRDDFVTVNGLDDTITVALRQAAGGFALTDYNTENMVYDVKLADVDGDGDIDVVYADVDSVDNHVYLRVRRNNGSGSFSTLTSTNLWVDFAHAPALTVGHWNQDGNADAVVTLSNSGLLLLHGNGNGTFSLVGAGQIAGYPWRIVNADMDEDGDLDLVIAHGIANKISIFRGTGSGSFSSSAFVISPGMNVFDVDTGDFDADGSRDLMIATNVGAYLIRANP